MIFGFFNKRNTFCINLSIIICDVVLVAGSSQNSTESLKMKFQGPEMISGETFQGPERSPGKSYSHLKEKEEGKDRISLEPLDSCTHGE